MEKKKHGAASAKLPEPGKYTAGYSRERGQLCCEKQCEDTGKSSTKIVRRRSVAAVAKIYVITEFWTEKKLNTAKNGIRKPAYGIIFSRSFVRFA